MTNQALEEVLTSKGFKTHSGTIEEIFGNNYIHSFEPNILIWDERLLNSRGSSIFDLGMNGETAYQSVFILSKQSMKFLGLGLTNGIEGFVHIKGGLAELEKCLLKVLRGAVYISPILSGTHQLNGQVKKKSRQANIYLTEQEERILRFVSQKKTSKKIGKILNISTKTVQNHRQNICNKLGLSGRNKLYEFSLMYFD